MAKKQKLTQAEMCRNANKFRYKKAKGMKFQLH